MIDISVLGLNKYYGAAHVLRDISFDVQRGERVGLLGDNGSGKTTLFQILAGELDYDLGTVMITPESRIGMIQQIPTYPAEFTVEQVLHTAFLQFDKLKLEINELEKRLESESSPSVIARYGELVSQFENQGGYSIDTELNKICNGLGISPVMREQLFLELSGGEKTRISLACAILQNTDILLLDEPTNHLDMDAVEWLEDYVLKFSGTVLIISHDRYFIDRCVTRIIEISEGSAEFYAGNYSFYVAEKEARFQEQLKKYMVEQKKIEQLSFAAERLHGWGMGNKKLQVRAFAIEKRIDRIRQTEHPQPKKRELKAQFSSRDFYGDKVMRVKDVTKIFGDRVILNGITLDIENGDRIALIGDNGSGKTTLLKIMTDELLPDTGWVRLGPSIKYGILQQNIIFDDESRMLIDTMIYALNMTPQTARNHLAAFDFTEEDVFKQVSVLSGGERSRLKLCMLMARNINLLILDEPTNHLDISSREWIETAVDDFDGALIFVSHDRYFISRFANRIWELSDGDITDFIGSFEEYRKAKQNAVKQEQIKREKVRISKPKPVKAKTAEKKIAEIEREIELLETRINEIDRLMESASSDFEELSKLYEEKGQRSALLDEKLAIWEQLQVDNDT